MPTRNVLEILLISDEYNRDENPSSLPLKKNNEFGFNRMHGDRCYKYIDNNNGQEQNFWLKSKFNYVIPKLIMF